MRPISKAGGRRIGPGRSPRFSRVSALLPLAGSTHEPTSPRAHDRVATLRRRQPHDMTESRGTTARDTIARTPCVARPQASPQLPSPCGSPEPRSQQARDAPRRNVQCLYRDSRLVATNIVTCIVGYMNRWWTKQPRIILSFMFLRVHLNLIHVSCTRLTVVYVYMHVRANASSAHCLLASLYTVAFLPSEM